MNDDEAAKEILEEKKKIKLIPPDGGWGWLVAIGSYLITLLGPLQYNTFSILYSKLLIENETSSAAIAWIFNLAQVLWATSCFLAPSLCAEFGHRKIALAGSLLIGIGFILSSFVQQSQFLFLTYSLSYGIGSGLSISVWQFIIPQYFEKKRGRVIGFVVSGQCASQFYAPVLITTLHKLYGPEGTILIMGALTLNMCVGSCLFHPVEWHSKKEVLSSLACGSDTSIDDALIDESQEKEALRKTSEKMVIPEGSKTGSSVQIDASSSLSIPPTLEGQSLELDSPSSSHLSHFTRFFRKCLSIAKLIAKNIRLFQFLRVIFITISFSITSLVYANFIMLISFTVISKGGSLEIAAKGMTVMGLCNMLVRLVVSTLTDVLPLQCKWYYVAGSLLASASIFAFSFVVDEVWIYICLGGFGLGIGTCICLSVILIIDTMGLNLMPSVTGAYGLVNIVSFFVLGPLIGYVRDATQDFAFSLRLLSAIELVAPMLWIMMPLAVRFDKRRKQN